MKKALALALLLMVSASCLARNEYPRAAVKVSYSYPHKSLKTDAKAYDSEYQLVLLASPSYSKFYSPRTEFNDSLDSTPAGRAQSRQIMSAAVSKYMETGDESVIPMNHGTLYVFKSAADSIVTVYDSAGMMNFGTYTEPLAEMNWEVCDSSKTVLGYDCIMACTDYHGRHWTAWFTPEVPLQDGPWKLCGLPGLILEAEESSGQHAFIATGIESSDMEIRPIYTKKKYDKMSRRDLLQAQRNYLVGGASEVMTFIRNAPDGSSIEVEGTKPADAPDLHVDFLETDYH